MANVEELRRRLERIEREIDHLESMPDDDFVDGDAIQFKQRFPGSTVWYQYVAIKIGGRWHLSGKTWRDFTTWEKLAAALTSELTKDIWFADSWTELDW